MKLDDPQSDPLAMVSLAYLCKLLDMSRNTVMGLEATDPDFPKAKRMGERNIRFKRSDVARYVDSRCTEPAPGQDVA